jgi:hypothetical protein
MPWRLHTDPPWHPQPQHGRPRWPQAWQNWSVSSRESEPAGSRQSESGAAQYPSPVRSVGENAQHGCPRPPHVPQEPSAAHAPATPGHTSPIATHSFALFRVGSTQQPFVQTPPGQHGCPGPPHAAVQWPSTVHVRWGEHARPWQQSWPSRPQFAHPPAVQRPSVAAHAEPLATQNEVPSERAVQQPPTQNGSPSPQHGSPGAPQGPQTSSAASHSRFVPVHGTADGDSCDAIQHGWPSAPQATQVWSPNSPLQVLPLSRHAHRLQLWPIPPHIEHAPLVQVPALPPAGTPKPSAMGVVATDAFTHASPFATQSPA